MTIAGNPGIADQLGTLQEVVFYKGQQTVVVTASNANANAAVQIADLIGSRI